MKNFFASVAIALLALSSAACGTTRISPGYVGIVVNASGTDRGVSSYPAVTGRVFYNPFNTSIFEYPTFVQNVVWTHNVAEGNALNEEITFTNKDKMQISVDATVSYQLVADKVPAFYVKFRNDDLSTFTNGFMRNLVRDHFNMEAGKYSIDQIMGDNSEFLRDVRETAQSELTPLGVQIVQFGLIGAPRPPAAVIEQINASVHATQLTQQKTNELAQVQADMNKETLKATTYATVTLTKAKAEADANKEIAASITPTLVEYQRTQKWNGELPQVTGGGTIPMLNLNPKQ